MRPSSGALPETFSARSSALDVDGERHRGALILSGAAFGDDELWLGRVGFDLSAQP
jgi:hypothetical protein